MEYLFHSYFMALGAVMFVVAISIVGLYLTDFERAYDILYKRTYETGIDLSDYE